MKEKLFRTYQEYLNTDKKNLKDVRKRIQLLALLRLLAFSAVVLALIFYKTLGPVVALPVIVLGVVLFFWWIKQFIYKEKEKVLYSNLIAINEKELKALNDDYSVFESGVEFINVNHGYTLDLDIFGEGSIFQFLNRTTTEIGKKKLAEMLQNPTMDSVALRKQQVALSELAEYIRWRQLFSAKGNTSDGRDSIMLESLMAKVELKNAGFVKYLVIAQPVLSFVVLLSCIFVSLPWGFLLGVILINAGILAYFAAQIKNSYRIFGNQSKLLGKYQSLFLHIEEKPFQADLLKQLQKQLFSNNNSASLVLRKLQQAMTEFDYRQNILVGAVLNAMLIWDLKCVLKLYNWQKENEESMHHWFSVIADFDALSSFANLCYNQYEWVLPGFSDKHGYLQVENLAHPLLKASKRIGNDFKLNGNGQLAIITGANMAGKSTFLRSIGVNIVLALNGCKVCCDRMELNPVNVYSNMRTTDNLQKDESYFFAELLRLKELLDRIKSGEQLFILIDEMLKGTNSVDKLTGSRELVKQLIGLNAVGVVATHDLELTKIASDYPDQVRNMCFDVRLGTEDLIFDYKLSDGVTSTMNASFLMKKMGIIPASD